LATGCYILSVVVVVVLEIESSAARYICDHIRLIHCFAEIEKISIEINGMNGEWYARNKEQTIWKK
jgi:hypothetical protein